MTKIKLEGLAEASWKKDSTEDPERGQMPVFGLGKKNFKGAVAKSSKGNFKPVGRKIQLKTIA